MTQERGDGGDAGYVAALARIWAHSEPIMRERHAVLEEAAQAVLDGGLTPGQRQRAEGEAHKLAGSLGSFGLSEGSRLAREVEWLLRGTTPIEADRALRLAELVVALGREIDSGQVGVEHPAGEAGDARETAAVLVVEADRELAHRLVEEATGARLRASTVDSAAAARVSIAADRPDLVLVDPAATGEPDGGQAFLAELDEGSDPMPVIVLTAPGGKVGRAEAARLGSSAYLDKPMPPQKVIEAACRTLERLRPRSRILVVGGDPSTVVTLRGLLDPRGLSVESLDDVREFWSTIQRVCPDLLVLDAGGPPGEGARMCRMVRMDAAWERLPVVVLTGDTGDARVELLRAGADDIVAKPASGEELTVTIVNRLARSRWPAAAGEADPRTGLVGWPRLELDLHRMVAMARRYGRPLAVGVLAVDVRADLGPGLAVPVAEAARLVLGRLLRRSFRIEDAVGERGEHLVVALFGAEPAGALERLAGILETFRAEQISVGGVQHRATASAGLATYPVDGGQPDALVDAAAAAMRRARSLGGDRVQTVAGDEPPAYGSVDVLVVDDDDALAPMLIHALSTRGYRTQWISDGAEAAALLLAPDGLRARVILLDVGLPGLDGLSLLRQLAGAQVLDRCRVIMVTLRAGEEEVLQALELGAFDHVAKPLSIPLLLHRVRRAIESTPS